MRNLILSGGLGHAHDFAATSAAHAANLARVGITSQICDDPEALVDLGRFQLLTVNALHFTMREERFAAHRAGACSLSQAARDALARFVRSGGGLLAVHTASICFDDWPLWPALCGAAWDWQRSSHPPLGPVWVEPAAGHPITARLPPFELEDELYTGLQCDPEVRVLARARADGGAAAQPVLLVKRCGDGRVVHDTLGHGAGSLSCAGHAALLRRAALWALGAADMVVAAA
jgi:hypothetical protein